MAVLSKHELLALKPKMETVDVPELGEGAQLCLMELDALSVFEFLARIRDLEKQGIDLDQQPQETAHWILERSLATAEGERLFGPGEIANVAWSWKTQQRLMSKALEISGIIEGQEGTRKNSSPSAISHAA